MSVCTVSYGATTSIAVTLTSLAAKAGRESTAMSNVTDKATDGMIQAHYYMGIPSSDSVVYVYFYGSADGAKYDAPVTGVDAACNIPSAHSLRGPWVIPATITNSLTAQSATCISVAQYFGGTLPQKWGVVVNNEMNVSIGATATTSWGYIPVWYSAS